MATKLLNAMKSILILLCITATINAQTPPMPPMPTTNLPTMAMQQPKHVPKKTPTFTTTCPHCNTKLANMRPSLIVTNGGVSTNGGTIIQRTLTFDCTIFGCREPFTSKNTVFMPESIAVEEDSASARVPGGAGSGASIQNWTTDPNLRLTVQLTNCPSPLFGLTSTQVPAQGLVSYPNGVLVTQAITGTLPVFCSKTAVIKFTTEVGKTYKCQASDDDYTPGDPRKTWIDGLPVAGTGGMIVQAEAADKPRRVYRVVVL